MAATAVEGNHVLGSNQNSASPDLPIPSSGPGVYLVKPACQNYAWGKPGLNSAVAKYISSAFPDSFVVDESLPYAELWIGTHPNGPNSVIGVPGVEGDTPLKELIESHPDLLGDPVVDQFGKGSLPFLFKVLSVNKALSIQAHPNKEHAQRLHTQSPQHYPDKNHKPEMAIALTPFEGFCGFRPYAEIRRFLTEVPEFRQVVTEGLAKAFCQAVEGNSHHQIQKFAMKACFSSIYDREEAFVQLNVKEMIARLKKTPVHSDLMLSVVDLLERLNIQYPGDVGIFCTFFLNRILLKPGQAMFLGPNEPHAYLSGDCVECMANSDNVVRAGLTPKFKDVKTLCAMLNYDGSTAESKIFESTIHGNVVNYKPSIHDFAVSRITIQSMADSELSIKKSASMLLVTRGEGMLYAGKRETGGVTMIGFKPGAVFFVGAGKFVKIQNMDRDTSMVVYRAFCNVG